MKRILWVAMHRPDRSPSQRFRFEQYIDYLRENGFDSDYSYLISAEDDKVLYSPGNYFGKLKIFLKSAAKRLGNVLDLGKYDIVFIQREAFMIGTTLFEKLFAKSKAKVVFDFDDSIWRNQGEAVGANTKLLFLKNPDKTKDIIAASDLIFAGNEYLANYSRQFNKNVVIVPTTIDTTEYERAKLPPHPGRVCVGWSGSFTTIEHFETAIPALRKLKAKYGDKVYFKVIGDGSYRNEELGIVGLPWRKNTEIEDLSEIDVGIMPLPDTEWAKGKCGLKGLQYMALEIATLMSPVGVNSTIIQDGVNGYLANQPDEWVDKISRLIDNEALRLEMGRAGRQTVVDQYSVISERGHYLQLFRELTA
ncbi:glycosyltransferase family 4 protein [Hymenobacter ruricola]|uniref:Glycosyltransferase family 4 protein n=1 Tax=Hymenobacter ruricola TaxID=2791023 RepID=A0ABS0IA08_9BACT|nr:glycosyltransferase family 4 protein [Hymenobacter ruricola]MBF9223812.1 glycosyltransferase family 4 protein [Hymenobacter ruricola]